MLKANVCHRCSWYRGWHCQWLRAVICVATRGPAASIVAVTSSWKSRNVFCSSSYMWLWYHNTQLTNTRGKNYLDRLIRISQFEFLVGECRNGRGCLDITYLSNNETYLTLCLLFTEVNRRLNLSGYLGSSKWSPLQQLYSRHNGTSSSIAKWSISMKRRQNRPRACYWLQGFARFALRWNSGNFRKNSPLTQDTSINTRFNIVLKLWLIKVPKMTRLQPVGPFSTVIS